MLFYGMKLRTLVTIVAGTALFGSGLAKVTTLFRHEQPSVVECEHSSQSLTGGREVCRRGMFAFLESRPSDRRERAIRRSLPDGAGSLLNLHKNRGYSKRSTP